MRAPTGQQHEKLRELVHADFFDFAPVAGELAGYDACFFCLGVSSAGMKEPEYTRVTYDLGSRADVTVESVGPDGQHHSLRVRATRLADRD